MKVESYSSDEIPVEILIAGTEAAAEMLPEKSLDFIRKCLQRFSAVKKIDKFEAWNGI